MNFDCPEKGVLVEERMKRVITQYRESPKLLHLIKTYLSQVEESALRVCDLPSYFHIDTAVGDQLTLIGKRLGWPRCHCVCEVQPVFGFDCEGVVEDQPVAGFCDDNVTWKDCGEFGIGDICIMDDEIYRNFLKVRCYQMLFLFDIESLNEAVKIFWGDDALVLDSGDGRVVIAPGRDLTDTEIALLQLYPRVLPVALGIEIRFHFDIPKVFGFGDGWGGFCEPLVTAARIENLTADGESHLVTESETYITTGPLTEDAPWMCELDVKPYSC